MNELTKGIYRLLDGATVSLYEVRDGLAYYTGLPGVAGKMSEVDFRREARKATRREAARFRADCCNAYQGEQYHLG